MERKYLHNVCFYIEIPSVTRSIGTSQPAHAIYRQKFRSVVLTSFLSIENAANEHVDNFHAYKPNN